MGIMVEEKQKPKKRSVSLSWILEQKDKALIKEEKWERNNICHKCFIVKTKMGKCSMGCDE